MPDLPRDRLVELAEEKLADAKFLLDSSRASNAYYLAGYAVELLLKAAISSRFHANTIPDPSWLRDIFQHDLEKLTKLALPDSEVQRSSDADDEFKGSWNIVLEWKETSRYYVRDKSDAETLVKAIDDPKH